MSSLKMRKKEMMMNEKLDLGGKKKTTTTETKAEVW
jgi:hypothetical protein